MARILFVTGVSCAGKTSLGEALADRDGVTEGWWDVDKHADRAPTTGHLNWLHWRAAECLNEASEVPGTPDALYVITGIIWPFRVIESSAWPPASDLRVEWLMLDPPWKVLRERLEERTADKTKAERRDLVRYNRELRDVLRRQVLALHGGSVMRHVVPVDEHAAALVGAEQ